VIAGVALSNLAFSFCILPLPQWWQAELELPDEQRDVGNDLNLGESTTDAGSRAGGKGDIGVSVPVGAREETGGVEGVGVGPMEGVDI
jgi:hypothetical protein